MSTHLKQMLRMSKFFLILFCLFCSIDVWSQYSKLLRVQQLKGFGNYEKAIDKLEKIHSKTPLNNVGTTWLAELYFESEDYESAEKWLQEATNFNNINKKYHYLLGKTLVNLGEIEDAKEVFKNAGRLGKEDLKFHSSNQKNSDFEIYSLTDLNTSQKEIGCFQKNEQFFFLSDRDKGRVFWKQRSKAYQVVLIGKSKLMAAPEMVDYLSKSGIRDFTTVEERNNYILSINKRPLFFQWRKQPYFVLQEYSEGEKKLEKLNTLTFLNKEYSATNPFVTSDGNTLYFAADMPGGFGGYDIYYSRWEGDKWSAPRNLGPEINSSLDELHPFYEGETLYFSSKGLAGYGGFDIFLSTRNQSGWNKPINLGKPLNSRADEYAFHLFSDNFGTISSNREEGEGNIDIYFIKKP